MKCRGSSAPTALTLSRSRRRRRCASDRGYRRRQQCRPHPSGTFCCAPCRSGSRPRHCRPAWAHVSAAPSSSAATPLTSSPPGRWPIAVRQCTSPISSNTSCAHGPLSSAALRRKSPHGCPRGPSCWRRRRRVTAVAGTRLTSRAGADGTVR